MAGKTKADAYLIEGSLKHQTVFLSKSHAEWYRDYHKQKDGVELEVVELFRKKATRKKKEK